jgi:CBS domain-containing protein
MVSEAGDVQAFLAQHPPFNHLSDDQLEFASANIYVAFSKPGNELQLNTSSQAGPSTGMLMVRSGSLEIRDQQGVLIDRLSSGDYIVPAVLYSDSGNIPRIVVLEDCLYYELGEKAFQSLSATSKEIAAVSEADRTSIVDSDDNDDDWSYQADDEVERKDAFLGQYVKDTMSNVIIFAAPETSIREAAQLMKQHHISSLLVKDKTQLVGIITDRDFRIRVLAEGVPDSDSIETVMTPDPMTLDVDSLLQEAQLKMMAEGIRHLPVLDKQKPVGIISQTDILRANNIEPISLIHSISRANSIEKLSKVAAEIPDLVVKLVARDTRAIEVGKIITTLSDGVTKRLLNLATEEFGSPPCDYAWLAFGSQARQEQALGSDQDNGLLLPDGISDKDAGYFKKFAKYVNGGLDQCGIPFCPGDIMAKNKKWRMTLKGWKRCFNRWIDEPSPKAVMHSSIFFDMRLIAGNTELVDELRDYVLDKAQSNTIFLAMMCDNALLHSPPLGFFKTFVLETDGDHNHTLDLKKRGTIPIVDVARNYALSVGIASLNTIERLHAIMQHRAMSAEMSYSLIDAYEFIAGLRLEAQGKEYNAGLKADNYLDPKGLSPLLRHQLKDAFNVVREAQAAMKARFGGGVL